MMQAMNGEQDTVDPENPSGEDIMDRVGGVHQAASDPPPLNALGVNFGI